jgi:hypothetical protein
MSKTIIVAIENEKKDIREGIAEFGLHTRDKIIYWGERLRLLQPKIRGEFEEYLDTLPISNRTAYNWITASKQMAEGKKAEKISKLFTYEPSESSAKVASGDSVTASTYDELEAENDEIDEEEEDEWEPKTCKPVSVQAHVIDNDKTQLDRYGQEIPETMIPVFTEVSGNFKRWKRTLESVKKEMMDNLGEMGYEWLDKRTIEPRFDNLYEILRMAQPHCVCPVCQGDGGIGANCKVCQGRGRITKPIFNAVDDDFKVGLNIK